MENSSFCPTPRRGGPRSWVLLLLLLTLWYCRYCYMLVDNALSAAAISWNWISFTFAGFRLLCILCIAPYPPTVLIWSRYVSSLAVPTSLLNFFSSTASQMFPSHFLLARFLENFWTTISTSEHLLWIHLPLCMHKIELSFLSSCRPHMVNLTLVRPSFVILPLIITLVCLWLPFKPLLLRAFFHFMNFFLSHSIVSLIRIKSSAFSILLSTSYFANSVTIISTTAIRKGDGRDLWCMPTITCSHNSQSILTLVFAPS